MAKGDTRWSDEIPGDRGNYEWPAQFSVTDGYVNIYQKNHADPDHGTESVLLSPAQVRALVAFVGKGKPAKRRVRASARA